MPRRPAWMTAEDRFAEKCRPAASGCVEWTASTTLNNGKGYGVFYHERAQHVAHRWRYEQVHGKQPKSIEICHHCDNPKCVNLDHLFAGTRLENMRDCVRKGRHRPPPPRPPEDTPQAVLNWEKANEIRTLHRNGGRTCKLAKQFEVSHATIYRVVNNHSWKQNYE